MNGLSLSVAALAVFIVPSVRAVSVPMTPSESAEHILSLSPEPKSAKVKAKFEEAKFEALVQRAAPNSALPENETRSSDDDAVRYAQDADTDKSVDPVDIPVKGVEPGSDDDIVDTAEDAEAENPDASVLQATPIVRDAQATPPAAPPADPADKLLRTGRAENSTDVSLLGVDSSGSFCNPIHGFMDRDVTWAGGDYIAKCDSRAKFTNVEVDGPCGWDGICATSPNYPNNYANNQRCTFRNLPPRSAIQQISFNVENAYSGGCIWDYIEFGGKRFCGTNGPAGHAVWPSGTMTWRSDYSVTRGGFKLCFAPTNPSSTSVGSQKVNVQCPCSEKVNGLWPSKSAIMRAERDEASTMLRQHGRCYCKGLINGKGGLIPFNPLAAGFNLPWTQCGCPPSPPPSPPSASTPTASTPTHVRVGSGMGGAQHLSFGFYYKPRIMFNGKDTFNGPNGRVMYYCTRRSIWLITGGTAAEKSDSMRRCVNTYIKSTTSNLLGTWQRWRYDLPHIQWSTDVPVV